MAAAAIAAILVAASAAGGSAPQGHARGQDLGDGARSSSEATGAEQKHFQAVLADSRSLSGHRHEVHVGGTNLTTILSTAVAGGNPPDMALLPQPGFMRELVKKKALKPIDVHAKDTIKRDWSPGWLALGSVGGKLYGLYLKGANKSTIWYNVKLFKNAGVKPPQTFPALLKAAKTLKASGTKAYSIGGGDGWTLTDLFENIYLRQAGGSLYDKLSAHKIKWTHPSVKKALKTMAQVFKDSGNIAGGTSGALTTVFADSVTQAFGDNPKAAMVLEGDFVGGIITASTKCEAGDGLQLLPVAGDQAGSPLERRRRRRRRHHVQGQARDPRADEVLRTRAGGDGLGEAGRLLLAEQAGEGSVYHDPITRGRRSGWRTRRSFRFDMSDLQPAAFGGTAGPGRVEALPGPPEEPERRQRDRNEAGGGRNEGLRP